jgi:O-antigen ligase
VRRVALSAACAILLAGPAVLSFFTGGYFAGPRAWAGLLAWLLVALAAGLGTGRLRWSPGVTLTLAGSGGLAALGLASMLWAPIVSNAYHSSQIAILYLGIVLAGALLLLDPLRLRTVEPALAAGATLVIGYGLSERLLPGVLHFAHSVSAQGRLEQPLTYWNAMGELAAIGLVLCARLAGDRLRPEWLRGAAAASAVLLGVGLYDSFSRGALFAAAAGLLALAVMAPTRQQLGGLGVCLAAAVLASVAAAPFSSVTSLSGSLGTREGQGATVLALLVVIAAASVTGEIVLSRRATSGRVRLPRGAGIIATLMVCAGLAVAITVGAHESSAASERLPGGSSRLVTLQSNRYAYWRVALRAFATEPFHGVGAGNWSVYWLRWRKIREGAQDAHSLPLQTLAELGVLGAIALLAFLGGLWLSARQALRRTAVAAGPAAGLVAYVAHAPLDWDWQMPALSLMAMILAGALLAIVSQPADGLTPDPVAVPSPSQVASGA